MLAVKGCRVINCYIALAVLFLLSYMLQCHAGHAGYVLWRDLINQDAYACDNGVTIFSVCVYCIDGNTGGN